MVKTSDKRKKEDDRFSSKAHNLDELRHIIEDYKSKFNLNTYEIIDLILSKKKSEKSHDLLPASLFRNLKLSGLEIIVKYLREEFNLKYREIAKLLNRNIGTITSTYRKTTTKHPEKLTIADSKIKIPLSIFSDRKLSILEHLSAYMKDKLSLKLKEIADLLNKNPRTIWTCYNRAKNKGGAV